MSEQNMLFSPCSLCRYQFNAQNVGRDRDMNWADHIFEDIIYNYIFEAGE